MKTSLFKSLYFQVLTAIAIGILLGHFYPELGAQMKPLGDAFVKLIKMVIAPVIFCTVVTGIAGMESMKAVGRTGAVALLYFEVVSTIALIIGLIIVNVVQPGAGMNVDPSTLDAKAVAVYAEQAKDQGWWPSCWTLSRAASLARSPAATSCRCCCLPCCLALRCTVWAAKAS
jgi:aerobic C4-dicarboxylate transport protein